MDYNEKLKRSSLVKSYKCNIIDSIINKNINNMYLKSSIQASSMDYTSTSHIFCCNSKQNDTMVG